MAGIAFGSAAGKSGNNFPAASKFAGKPFQQGISDSHSLLELSESYIPFAEKSEQTNKQFSKTFLENPISVTYNRVGMNGDTFSIKAPKECPKKFAATLKGKSLTGGNVLRIFFLFSEDFGVPL